MANPHTENCAEKAVDGAEYPANGVFEMIEKRKKERRIIGAVDKK